MESVGWVWDGYDGELDTISPEFIIPKVAIPGYGHHTFDEGLAFAEKWLRRFVRWELDGGMVMADFVNVLQFVDDDQRMLNYIEAQRARRTQKWLEAQQVPQETPALALAFV